MERSNVVNGLLVTETEMELEMGTTRDLMLILDAQETLPILLVVSAVRTTTMEGTEEVNLTSLAELIAQVQLRINPTIRETLSDRDTTTLVQAILTTIVTRITLVEVTSLTTVDVLKMVLGKRLILLEISIPLPLESESTDHQRCVRTLLVNQMQTFREIDLDPTLDLSDLAESLLLRLPIESPHEQVQLPTSVDQKESLVEL